MKKFAFIFVAAIAASFAVSMSSCTKAAQDSDSVANDSAVVEVEVADTAVADSAAADSVPAVVAE